MNGQHQSSRAPNTFSYTACALLTSLVLVNASSCSSSSNDAAQPNEENSDATSSFDSTSAPTPASAAPTSSGTEQSSDATAQAPVGGEPSSSTQTSQTSSSGASEPALSSDGNHDTLPPDRSTSAETTSGTGDEVSQPAAPGGGEFRSMGCGTAPPTDDLSIEIDGSESTYILDLPANYDSARAYPLVFAFHGAGVAPEIFKTFFNISANAGADAIVVTPNAVGNASAWNSTRDLPLFDALVEKLTSQLCVDQSRIFAAGHSSGGMFTHSVGCERSDVVRGIAPASSGPPRGACGGKVAVWIAQGLNDETVSVESGRAARDFWAAIDECDTSMATPTSPDTCVSYGGCAQGYPVHYCEYDGTHNIPSYTAKAIWDFFSVL